MPVAPGPLTAPQKPAASAPATDTIGVATILASLVPTEPTKVVSAVHVEPLLFEYMKLKLLGPVPDARPMTPLSVMLEYPTVDAQNFRPAAGNADSQFCVYVLVLAAL